jgi:cytochrome c-type biogenesis protein CcmH
LAQDLRSEVRTLIKTGQSDAQIMEFMVSRYGDFVRYRPPVKPVTWVLWFGPLLLLAAAVVFLVRLIRKQQRGDSSQRPDAQQRAKAQSLLQDKPTSS